MGIDNAGTNEAGIDAPVCSKSQRKRDAEAQQKLGEVLVALSPEHLAQVPLSEEVLEAVQTAQRIRERGGRRRQLQLIGKLMRREDTEPIRAALDTLEGRSAAAIAGHKQAEMWRERLLGEGDTALAEFLVACPGADPQRLRQLMRNANRQAGAGQPARASRELFRLLRRSLEEH